MTQSWLFWSRKFDAEKPLNTYPQIAQIFADGRNIICVICVNLRMS